MDTNYLYGEVTHKPSGRKESFPVKVSLATKQGIMHDLGIQSGAAQGFGAQACQQLGWCLGDCVVSLLKPEGTSYQIFLKSLKQFSEQQMSAMAIDLSSFQYRSDA